MPWFLVLSGPVSWFLLCIMHGVVPRKHSTRTQSGVFQCTNERLFHRVQFHQSEKGTLCQAAREQVSAAHRTLFPNDKKSSTQKTSPKSHGCHLTGFVFAALTSGAGSALALGAGFCSGGAASSTAGGVWPFSSVSWMTLTPATGVRAPPRDSDDLGRCLHNRTSDSQNNGKTKLVYEDLKVFAGLKKFLTERSVRTYVSDGIGTGLTL